MKEIKKIENILTKEGWQYYPGALLNGSETYTFVQGQSIIEVTVTLDADEEVLESILDTA